MAETLFRLALHTGDDTLSSAAERTLADLAPMVKRQPSAFASALTASAYAGLAPLEVKIAGRPDDPRAQELLAVVRSAYLPARSIAWQREERASVLLCHGGACDAPVTSPAALARVLASPARRTA